MRDPLLHDSEGHVGLLLGNEAIVRGALEAGVGFASGYPGTPSSEVTDGFARVAAARSIVFEYSVNEKIALEMAFAASLAGARSICAMKHLGLMVGGNTYRHPAVVAKMALTLDNISGGRAVLGLGAGWQLNEHQRFGIPLPSVKDRSDMLEEAVALCRVMFEAGDGRVDFTGSHYQLTQAPVAPGPVNGRLPIMVGGAGAKRTLRTVARHADEWNAWGRPDTIAGHLDVLRGHCDREGRSFDDLHITAVGLLIIVDDAEQAQSMRDSMGPRSGLVGTVDELKAVIEEYEAVGVHELLVPDFAIVGPEKLSVLERFNAEVLGN